MKQLFLIFSELEQAALTAEYREMLAIDARFRQAIHDFFTGRQKLTAEEKAGLEELLCRHDSLTGQLQQQKESLAIESRSLQRSARAEKRYSSISLST